MACKTALCCLAIGSIRWVACLIVGPVAALVASCLYWRLCAMWLPMGTPVLAMCIVASWKRACFGSVTYLGTMHGWR